MTNEFLKVAEGKNAKVGDLIALTVEADEDWKSVEMPDGASAPAASAPAPAAAAAPVGPIAEPPPGQYVFFYCFLQLLKINFLI